MRSSAWRECPRSCSWRLGAKALRGDVLDPEGIRRLICEAAPEAVVNLATAIPLRLRIDPRDWERNDRLRVEGTSNLLAGAQEAGARLFIQESVGYICRPQGVGWIEEDAPLSTHPFLKATIQMEDLARSAPVPTTILRFGALMAADSWHTQQSVAALRRGWLPIIGEGDAYLSLIHVEDAAQSICRALESPAEAAGQTFNVVDEEPAPMRDVFPYAARLLGAPAPKHMPPFVAKMTVGAITVDILTASYRLRSEKIRRALHFTPRYPSYRQTWKQIVEEIGGREVKLSDDLR